MGIRIATTGMLDKLAPVGHNLDGVDVPVGVGLGMVDIPSMVVVGTAYFVQDVHKVAEGLDSGPGYSVPGFEVEDSQPAREVVVCFVPVGSEGGCYVPARHSTEEVRFEECSGFVGEWEAVSRLAQVCSIGELGFGVSPH